MVKEVKFVIGANYGDEGKGVMSDYYTRIARQNGHTVLNVLYNGGCQRGHTVLNHVFHCFGAGALRGADTYYTRNFMFNPTAWWFEFQELNQQPMLYINENCRVTTPYDVHINQLIEEKRGNKRHGSCGLGIFETRKRCEETEGLYAKDLLDSEVLYQKLHRIKNIWAPVRCEELDVQYSNDNIYELDNFISCVEQALKSGKIKICGDEVMLNYNTVIFEGGQGLLLSETNTKDFPHLTPSDTRYHGAVNELYYIYKNSNANFEFCMMTRPYLTRHGAGPLLNECKREDISDKIVDETNMPNQWQGSLRFAPIADRDGKRLVCGNMNQVFSLSLNIAPDFCSRASYSIGITCLDQTNGKIKYWSEKQNGILDVDYNNFGFVNQKIYAFFGKDTLPIITL